MNKQHDRFFQDFPFLTNLEEYPDGPLVIENMNEVRHVRVARISRELLEIIPIHGVRGDDLSTVEIYILDQEGQIIGSVEQEVHTPEDDAFSMTGDNPFPEDHFDPGESVAQALARIDVDKVHYLLSKHTVKGAGREVKTDIVLYKPAKDFNLGEELARRA